MSELLDSVISAAAFSSRAPRPMASSPVITRIMLAVFGGEEPLHDGPHASWSAAAGGGNLTGRLHAACWYDDEGRVAIETGAGAVMAHDDGQISFRGVFADEGHVIALLLAEVRRLDGVEAAEVNRRRVEQEAADVDTRLLAEALGGTFVPRGACVLATRGAHRKLAIINSDPEKFGEYRAAEVRASWIDDPEYSGDLIAYAGMEAASNAWLDAYNQRIDTAPDLWVKKEAAEVAYWGDDKFEVSGPCIYTARGHASGSWSNWRWSEWGDPLIGDSGSREAMMLAIG